jgi:hypothetical protein
MTERFLSIMPTFGCPAECSDCATASSPRDKTRLPLHLQLSGIDQAAAAGFSGVIFTGGEATLTGRSLAIAMRRASGHGLGVRLVTNGHWAATLPRARECVQTWFEAGLTELNLSTGDEHARFVPLDRIWRAVEAAVESQLPVAIIVETSDARQITPDLVNASLDLAVIHRKHPRAEIAVIPWVWARLFANPSPNTPAAASQTTGCSSLFHHPTLQADGTWSPCCGLGIRWTPELQLGNVAEMTLDQAMRRARQNPLLERIHRVGPEAPDAEHACHACMQSLSRSREKVLIPITVPGDL